MVLTKVVLYSTLFSIEIFFIVSEEGLGGARLYFYRKSLLFCLTVNVKTLSRTHWIWGRKKSYFKGFSYSHHLKTFPILFNQALFFVPFSSMCLLCMAASLGSALLHIELQPRHRMLSEHSRLSCGSSRPSGLKKKKKEGSGRRVLDTVKQQFQLDWIIV